MAQKERYTRESYLLILSLAKRIGHQIWHLSRVFERMPEEFKEGGDVEAVELIDT